MDLPALARSVNPALDALREEPRFAASRLVLETGRYLVGEAGFYLTRVVNLKQSRGTTLADAEHEEGQRSLGRQTTLLQPKCTNPWSLPLGRALDRSTGEDHL